MYNMVTDLISSFLTGFKFRYKIICKPVNILYGWNSFWIEFEYQLTVIAFNRLESEDKE